MLIEDILHLTGERFPGKVAFQRRSMQLTFGELERVTEKMATALNKMGAANQHIGLIAGNHIEYAAAYFAITKSKGVAVPFAPSTSAKRLAREVDFCDVTHILAARDLATTCSSNGYSPIYQFDQNWGAGGLALFETKRQSEPCLASFPDTALLLPTSGTSSAPKRVMLSHSNVVENMLSFLNFAGLQTEDQGLIALPLMSSGTNTTEFLAYIHSGITAILYPHGTFSLWNYCNEAKVTSATVANVTPFILNLLAQHAQDVGDLLDGVRKFFCASAPLGARAIRELSRVFPRTQFCYGYGLTEAGPRCTMLDSSMFSLRIGSAGKALRGVEVGVESSAGTATAQGSGEIVIRGPNVMQGYYKSREETNRVLRDSWLHTGDLGHLDPEGFLYVRGRQKNVILCRGVTICPGEVEETLLEHPAIAEAAVTGLPDALEYQKVGAKVVLRPGYKLSEGDLLSFLAARLEMIKCPRQIEFVPALLRNQLHKVTDPSVQGGDFDCF